MTLQEKNDLELIQRFHDEFSDITEGMELSDDDLDNIEENYSEELFEMPFLVLDMNLITFGDF